MCLRDGIIDQCPRAFKPRPARSTPPYCRFSRALLQCLDWKVKTMLDELDKAIAALDNPDAGWVNRRDAAELLGQAGARAIEALEKHREEPDVDVRKAIDAARRQVDAGTPGKPQAPGLDELVRALEQPGRRDVAKRGDGFQIDLAIKDGRRQKVMVMPSTRNDGHPIIRIYTRCAKPTEAILARMLRLNMSLAQCAVALSGPEDNEMLVMVNCFLADEVTPEAFKSSVKEVAFYADWLEEKLTGADRF